MTPAGSAAEPRRSTAGMQRLAAVGGCAFAAFWTMGVFDVSIPWLISLPVHGFAMLALAVGVVALHAEQTRARAEPPWTWIPPVAVAASVFFSFEVFLISTILFGFVVIHLGRLPQKGAVLLVAGATSFLFAFSLHGPFWSENNPEPPVSLALVFTSGLALMAAGWVVLGTAAPATTTRPAEEKE